MRTERVKLAKRFKQCEEQDWCCEKFTCCPHSDPFGVTGCSGIWFACLPHWDRLLQGFQPMIYAHSRLGASPEATPPSGWVLHNSSARAVDIQGQDKVGTGIAEYHCNTARIQLREEEATCPYHWGRTMCQEMGTFGKISLKCQSSHCFHNSKQMTNSCSLTPRSQFSR